MESSRKAFQDLSDKQTQANIELWTKQAEDADRRRLSKGVEVLDIYETAEQKGSSYWALSSQIKSWLRVLLQCQQRPIFSSNYPMKSFRREPTMA